MLDNYILANEIIFDSKPDAVPYNYRISYKMSQLCLILSNVCTNGSGCTLVKLHIISNALNTVENMKILDDYVNERTAYMIVRFDPAVNRAIKYAVGDGLIYQLKNGAFKLTDKGKCLVKEINKETDLLINEKHYLSELGNKLSATLIERLMSSWRYSNVEDK